MYNAIFAMIICICASTTLQILSERGPHDYMKILKSKHFHQGIDFDFWYSPMQFRNPNGHYTFVNFRDVSTANAARDELSKLPATRARKAHHQGVYENLKIFEENFKKNSRVKQTKYMPHIFREGNTFVYSELDASERQLLRDEYEALGHFLNTPEEEIQVQPKAEEIRLQKLDRILETNSPTESDFDAVFSRNWTESWEAP